ncbi:MAG TPA: FeoA family protein [Crinalium sp.]|jgi:ferrous iron transport protein A
MFNQSFTVSGSSLKLLRVGERGVVSGLRGADDTVARSLRAMGVVPGTTITLEQRSPRFVIKAGANRIALSENMIRAVYVRL